MNKVDLKKLWVELDAYEKELATESKVLEDVWVTIAELRKKNEDEMKSIGNVPELDFLDPHAVIILNVGGQIFEAAVEVLTKDPYSVLASFCRKDSPIYSGEDPHRRVFFLDRDWWIFRHLLSFLRSDILPTDLETLKELYREAIYYRVQSLQSAIEDFPIDDVHDSSS